MQDGLNFTAPPYGKVLLLGAIAAASAFVVTILIVVLCVGCQRKGKTHNVPGEGGKHRLMDMGILRQSKLRSISKSDTEMNKMNCNGKSETLMDFLYIYLSVYSFCPHFQPPGHSLTQTVI
uniref:Si:dkey-70p6.1 n=2 Tax=Haplochromini TaxID=319058 RepID=A0A3Q3BZ44_HAPBU